MARKKSRRRWIVLLLLALVAGGIAWAALFLKKDEVIAVQTEKVTRRDLTEVVVATGKIQPVVLVKISPEVSGEIIALPVKEGQSVEKGDLLVRIKPDFYTASRNSAEASLKASLSNKELAEANLKKAGAEFERIDGLFKAELVSASQHVEARTALEVAQAQVRASTHQSDVARAALARAEEELAKTTIVSPLGGTISKLNSQVGERVVGTAMMTGTEIMSIANLEDMEARVDIGEIDVVLIDVGQKARLEVDAFRDRKFNGEVTEIANTAKASGLGTQQEATRFEVRIRISEKESFRPGMSATAEIETRYRTNVLTVPIQSVTTRLPKGKPAVKDSAPTEAGNGDGSGPGRKSSPRKAEPVNKPVEVVFVREGGLVKAVPVTRGISDDAHVEIVEGLAEGQEIVSGGYKAINRDLEDGSKIQLGPAP